MNTSSKNLKTLVVVGAGGHGKVVADAAQASGIWDTIEMVDDAEMQPDCSSHWKITGKIQHFLCSTPKPNTFFVDGIGNNETRVRLSKLLLANGHVRTSIIHPNTSISTYCSIGNGCVIMAGACVNVDAQIGAMSVLNTGCNVEHDCRLGEGVHVSPGAQITGEVVIGDYSWVGAGAVIVNQAAIGKRCTVGAGAVVIKTVPDDSTVVGNPARIIKTGS